MRRSGKRRARHAAQRLTAQRSHNNTQLQQRWHAPVIVPYTTVPFFSSICTFSFASFIKNLQQGDSSQPSARCLRQQKHKRQTAQACSGVHHASPSSSSQPHAPNQLHHLALFDCLRVQLRVLQPLGTVMGGMQAPGAATKGCNRAVQLSARLAVPLQRRLRPKSAISVAPVAEPVHSLSDLPQQR